MNAPISRVEVRDERDVVLARQHARAVAARLGFEAQDQARIAAAVSEIARNAVQHAGSGLVEFLIDGDPGQALLVRVSDSGPGIAASPASAAPAAGRGLDGARRMMDTFRLDSSPGSGTVVAMARSLPRRAAPVTASVAAQVAGEMAGLAPPSPVDEILRQNREMIRALDDLRAREVELARLNRELEETNRGVLALYYELDERNDSLRRASEMKTRFLANVSHELRTPLTSIFSLSRILLDRTDGDLNDEQGRQVDYIFRAAKDLTGMVNGLLDLARIEAGREPIHLGEVDLAGFFGVLRGMLRPLLPADSPVVLAFDDPSGLPRLVTDEGKLAQILRNLVSNALKFTERGEVRVKAEPGPDGTVVLSVGDTGIGIAAKDLGRIFEEFGQVDGPLQRKAKGTGLGLPLARELAGLLGGRLDVLSEPGVGSTFAASIPIIHPDHARGPEGREGDRDA